MKRYRTTRTWAELSWVPEVQAIDLEHNQQNEIFNMNLNDLCDDWQAMLDWAKQEIHETQTQQQVFDVWTVLNRTASHFNEELGGGTFFTIPDSFQEISQKKLWTIKHPVTAAIAMGKTYTEVVHGTVLVYLKKEVNVQT